MRGVIRDEKIVVCCCVLDRELKREGEYIKEEGRRKSCVEEEQEVRDENSRSILSRMCLVHFDSLKRPACFILTLYYWSCKKNRKRTQPNTRASFSHHTPLPLQNTSPKEKAIIRWLPLQPTQKPKNITRPGILSNSFSLQNEQTARPSSHALPGHTPLPRSRKRPAGSPLLLLLL
jgi:hypothetical protein